MGCGSRKPHPERHPGTRPKFFDHPAFQQSTLGRHALYAAVNGIPHWMDINPRVGVAYDVFGNGRTAIKTRSVAMLPRPTSTSPCCSTRHHERQHRHPFWNDLNTATIDCDLGNLSANGECGARQPQLRQDQSKRVRWADDAEAGCATKLGQRRDQHAGGLSLNAATTQ
jgi:hypothetical protein